MTEQDAMTKAIRVAKQFVRANGGFGQLVYGDLFEKAVRAAIAAYIHIRASGRGKIPGFDLVAHLHRQRLFSVKTFGRQQRWKGVVHHIRKELTEIEDSNGDLSEWVDVILLAFDGAWRSGSEPEQITAALEAKQTKNESRKWPDWRTMSPDRAIEHDRTAPSPPASSEKD